VKHLLDRYLLNPHWRTLKVVGQAKVFGISATTIIIAPLLSRILIKLNEMETTIRQAHPALDAVFPLVQYNFQLPLPIKLLVGSAFCALLGKGIYEMRCPVYIKAGDSYEHYRNSQARASEILAAAFLKVMQENDKKKMGEIVSGLQALHYTFAQPPDPINTKWKQDTQIRLDYRGGGFHPVSSVEYTMRFTEAAEAIFSVMRDVMDDSRRAARVSCAVLYGLAFIFLSGALIIQMWWAARGMLL
jgi:hypothetical protein